LVFGALDQRGQGLGSLGDDVIESHQLGLDGAADLGRCHFGARLNHVDGEISWGVLDELDRAIFVHQGHILLHLADKVGLLDPAFCGQFEQHRQQSR